MNRTKSLVSALIIVLASAPSLGADAAIDMAIDTVEADMFEPTGELHREVWNGPDAAWSLLVQVTTTSSGESFVPARKLELVVSQSGKEIARKSLELEGASVTGERRFAIIFGAEWEMCVPIKVDVAIVGQTKKAAKTKVFSVQCGD